MNAWEIVGTALIYVIVAPIAVHLLLQLLGDEE